MLLVLPSHMTVMLNFPCSDMKLVDGNLADVVSTIPTVFPLLFLFGTVDTEVKFVCSVCGV